MPRRRSDRNAAQHPDLTERKNRRQDRQRRAHPDFGPDNRKRKRVGVYFECRFPADGVGVSKIPRVQMSFVFLIGSCGRSRRHEQVATNKKARRNFSRRAPTFELAGPGLRAPRCQASKCEGLAGDPSEVTALGKRHWITSFRCWWKQQYRQRICRC